MSKEKVLLVDDEEDILELLQYHFAREGYTIMTADSGEEALRRARNETPDMIILDLMLPGLDGLDVCRQLKKDTATEDIPLIMLTAKGEESDVIIGLELGADDYVTKPFSPKVLLARVRSVLRRREPRRKETDKIRIHDLIIDLARHEILVGSRRVELTFTEFRTLQMLAEKPGRVFTRYQIVDAIRGGEYAVTDRAVDVQIASLRKKLGSAGAYIETIRGIGYRFKD